MYTVFIIRSGIYCWFTYLFICSLFNYAASKLEYIHFEWLDKTERYVPKVVQESGRGLMKGITPPFAWRDWR
jgi:hypothetical protein